MMGQYLIFIIGAALFFYVLVEIFRSITQIQIAKDSQQKPQDKKTPAVPELPQLPIYINPPFQPGQPWQPPKPVYDPYLIGQIVNELERRRNGGGYYGN